MVHTQAIVGEICDNTVLLTSDELDVFRVPAALLPKPLAVGMCIELHTTINPSRQAQIEEEIREIQHALCARLQLPPPGAATVLERVQSAFSDAPNPAGAPVGLPPRPKCLPSSRSVEAPPPIATAEGHAPMPFDSVGAGQRYRDLPSCLRNSPFPLSEASSDAGSVVRDKV